MFEPQSRRACDRCHAQKLCCKREGNDSCLRCMKANIKCVFSPSLRSRKAQCRQNKDFQPAPSVQDRDSREGSASDTQNVSPHRIRASKAGGQGRPQSSSRTGQLYLHGAKGPALTALLPVETEVLTARSEYRQYTRQHGSGGNGLGNGALPTRRYNDG